MTFEELEVDWELWKRMPGDCDEFIALNIRCPHFREAKFTSPRGTKGVAVINGCIMLNYDHLSY